MRIIFSLLIFMISLPLTIIAAFFGFLYAKCVVSFMQGYLFVMRQEFLLQQKAKKESEQ